MAMTDYAPLRGVGADTPRLGAAPSPLTRPVDQTPEWWLKRLHSELSKRKGTYRTASAYYEGEHRLRFASAKYRKAFGLLFDRFADNWCAVVVDATDERLNVEGFRFPSGEGEDPLAGDRDAWDLWQRNQLDAGSQMLHVEALVGGCAYVLVWPEDGETAMITPESGEQVVVAYRPGSNVRVAALKEWVDDWTGYILGTLYLPDGVYKYQSTRKIQSENDSGQAEDLQWVKRVIRTEAFPLANPFDGVIPMVPFENRPRLTRPGQSEIKGVIPIQDAVNKLCADMLIASEFQSYRQRWATGVEINTDPETNQPVEPFKAAVEHLWVSASKETQFGDFEQADLQQFVTAIEMYIQHIASQSRTPPHYFFLRGEFPSGESIKSAETGLVAKAHRKMRHFGESWEEVMRLAFQVQRDPRAEAMNAETIWGDPESRSEAQHIDAIVKKQTLGVPEEQLWEDAGYSPQQIEKFLEMRAREPAVAPAKEVTGGDQQPPVG